MARDTEVEVMEILSEIDTCSLEGVPGRFIDAMLGCREGILDVVGRVGVAVGCGGGVSVLGVCTTRSVLGAFLTTGDARIGDSCLDDEIPGVCRTLR